MISHAEMVRKLAKSGEAIQASMTPQKLHVWHMASCLMGEAGELMAHDSSTNLKEELGDLEFYAEGLRNGFGYTIKDIPSCVIDENDMFASPFDGIMVTTCNIFDTCKKWIIYEKDLDCEKFLSYMAQFELYMQMMREEESLTREEVLQANMDKLSKRYGADYNYTNAAAQNRADKT